jgi:hypothetical protein
MKHQRLFLFIIIISFNGLVGFAQGFDRKDYYLRDNFFKTMQFSKGFHTKENLNCKTLNCDFVTWQFADTVHFNIHTLHVFFKDGQSDSIRLDTVFTSKDLSYIMAQFNYYRNNGQMWKDCYGWRVLKINPKSRWVIPYWEFSQPLYSEDYTKCLVKMNYYKKEGDYILSTVLFYKNKKGVWEEKAVIDAVGPAE